MEATSRTSSRLADALRAVSESAKSLRPGDESALLVFDREVETLLALKKRADAKTAMDQPWQLQPSGGTQLVPALEQAIKLLTNSEAQRRFLILVSDGFVDGENIPPLQVALRQADIQLIALAIGNDADLSTLHKLAASNGGQVLQVNDTAQLPRFMRQQLETKQNSWNKTPATPHTIQQAPFIDKQNSGWRQLHGHQLTRGKPSARVYVATDEGDPLLVIGQYGAGKIAALPGGILETVSAQDFLSGLLSWMDSRQYNPNLKVSHHYLSGQLSILVDAVDTDNRWLSTNTTEVILTNPGGFSHSQPMEAVAPGRFAAVLPAHGVGTYSAKIKIGNQQTLYTAYLADDREHSHNAKPATHWLEQTLSNGEIQHWTDTSLDDLLDSSSGHWATRPLWLLLALISYLCLIAFERSSGLHTLIKSLSSVKFWRKN
jgi:Ca-activated chloride channel family protein